MTGDTKDAALAAPATVSTADTDRYYAMRVDARASNMVDTVYDIAERLLAGEIESCRQTLEKLWALKNGAVADGLAIQLEELITCYQERLTAYQAPQLIDGMFPRHPPLAPPFDQNRPPHSCIQFHRVHPSDVPRKAHLADGAKPASSPLECLTCP